MKTLNMPPNLDPDDKRDLDKFTKFLALKSAQIIVQSRLGEKVKSCCRPNNTGAADWFNLAVRDVPEVLREAKDALYSEYMNDSPPTRMNLCVDIILKTVDGDTMVLETWHLGVLTSECCELKERMSVGNVIYNKMGLLLRSLVTVTRATPAYKLSRRQSPDSYAIVYKIYVGDPQFSQLGEGYKQVSVGQLCIPIGTIQIKVGYRTKMAISPKAVEKDEIMVKSDHFAPKPPSVEEEEIDNSCGLAPLKPGAFADTTGVVDYKLLCPIPEGSGWLWDLTAKKKTPKPKPKSEPTPPAEVKEEEKPVEAESPPKPFEGMTEREKAEWRREQTDMKCERPSSPVLQFGSVPSTFTCPTTPDKDLFMADFNPPFAVPDNRGLLGEFYRDCHKAPPLSDADQPFKETITDLGEQIKDFELEAPRFEEMVNNLFSTE